MNGQLTVAKIEDHRPATTATHVISYSLDGFLITTTIETSTPIRQLVDKLKSIGAMPPSPSPTKPADDDAPVCQYHGKMKVSKYGGWHCTAKMGSGEYCDQKVK